MALVGRPCDVGGLRSIPVQQMALTSRQMMLPEQSWDTGTMRLEDDVSRAVGTLADGLA